MKIEDCEVGMKVEPKHDIRAIGVSKGEKLVIRKVEKDTNGGCEGYLYFDEKGHVGVSAEYFELVTKFEVGDEVIYDNAIKKYKSVIFGIAKQKDKFDGKYAISFIKGSGRKVNKVVKERDLLPLKKPDNLEIGDKFRQKGKAEHEVVGVHYDEERKSKIYVVRLLDGEIKGAIDLVFPKTIKEIIYD